VGVTDVRGRTVFDVDGFIHVLFFFDLKYRVVDLNANDLFHSSVDNDSFLGDVCGNKDYFFV
jgi:hypothetical protein